MKTSEHPQLEDLLLWQSGELSPADAEAVELHLKHCSECQNTLANAESIFGRIANVDAEAERRRKHAASQQRWNRSAKVFKSRTFMGTTASVVIAALLFVSLTQWTPEARAESLLDKAVQEQTEGHQPLRFLKVESGSLACSVALGTDSGHHQLIFMGATSFCENVSNHLHAAGRQWNNLLSAKSFQQWRHSLAKKQDSIRKSDDMIEVSTVAENGAVREASLQLRSSDYHTVAAHFEFAGAGPLKIDVGEDHAAEESAGRALSLAQAEQQQQSLTESSSLHPVIDPLDETEARVRLALHKVQLDRNILLAVERKRDTVLVRDAASEALQNVPQVQLSILTEAEQQQEGKPLPWTSFQGEGAPLAYDQLNALFPSDESARQQFQNELDALTRNLVGEAKSRDALLALRSRLSTTQYDQPLESAAMELADLMHRDSLSLAARLVPLTGTIAHSGEPLNYRHAMQLYTLVHEMTFMGQKQGNPQLAQAVSKTRKLLSRR
jgi:hypothetical protein